MATTAGDDYEVGTAGDDVIDGLAGNDIILGGAGNDTLIGNDGNDVLKGEDGDDILTGGNNDDVLVGGLGNDNLIGGAGDDNLNGGPGADTMSGGTGNDYYTADADDTLVENLNEGVDTVRSYGTWTLGANFENLILGQSADVDGTGNELDNTITGNVGNNILSGLDGADVIYGMGGNDTLYGGDGNDILDGGNGDDFVYGGIGNDSLIGGSGNDWLDGGVGDDTMAGGVGDDTYVVDSATDVVTELGSQGTDTVMTTLTSYTLGANVEHLTGTLGAKQNLSGNAERNTITAGAGNDVIDGKGGNDILIGNGGDDRLTGGGGADHFIFNDNGVTYSTLGGFSRQVDVVMDFNPGEGDRIDLSAIDANINVGGDQAFTIVTNFTQMAGQMRVVYISGSNVTAIQLDMDGDGVADYQIQIKGGDFTTGVNILTGAEPVNQGGWIL